MYNYSLHHKISSLTAGHIEISGKDNAFYVRFLSNISGVDTLYKSLYADHPLSDTIFDQLLISLMNGYLSRPVEFRNKDELKSAQTANWFLSNKLCGMSLYVDRFAGSLKNLKERIGYFEKLGVNLLHLMPLFESPETASDGGYAVSDFRKINPKFGILEDLKVLRKEMDGREMYLMLDIVLNHTSDQHEWAKRARAGDSLYQDYYYFFPDRQLPDKYDQSMPEIFPESAPGNFTLIPESNQWVMTVFHHYQWDLNFRNPRVFVSMLENILFYANLGVDILRIDAPAFIWKALGTTSQNLPEAHTILRLIRLCVEIVSPGMAILGEAIVAPSEIMKYFGTGDFTARECDFAYNATQMALQWDALATSKTGLMISAQQELMKKPFGTSWISYTRSHDDIGFGFGDDLIDRAGFHAYSHRKFLKDYFSGAYQDSYARGALFSNNPKTQDARISGTLAALCGLEEAIETGDPRKIQRAISRILMMQAMSFFIGGLPMLFSGDEMGLVNDYSFLDDPSKSYDNRWMHRPSMNWNRIQTLDSPEATEYIVFSETRRLLDIRKKLTVLSDHSNIFWLQTENDHVAGFVRSAGDHSVFCLFNFSGGETSISWWVLNQQVPVSSRLREYGTGLSFTVGADGEKLFFDPYQFYIFVREEIE